MDIPSYLLNEQFDDRYFDVVNAVDEARQIYFDNSNLSRRFAEAARKEGAFRIGETGFGAGRTLAALLDFLEQSGTTGLNVVFNSVELYPVAPQRMSLILDGFRDQIGPCIERMLDLYSRFDISCGGWHHGALNGTFGTLKVNLWIGEALEMVTTLEHPCDAWFLDGHGPKKNPGMWRPELLTAVGAKTVRGGTFATFTVAGFVRRSLADAGFMVEQCPGSGWKKSFLRGVKV